MDNLFTMSNIRAFIGTSYNAGAWAYAELSAGLDNVAEALNEVQQKYQFLNNGGFGSNHITGMAPVYSFSGRRVQGDAAQDYIFSKKYVLDTGRASSFKLEWDDTSSGSTVTRSVVVPCTISGIQEFGGSPTDDAAIKFDICFDGAPVTANVASLPALVVVSVAGETTGKTAVYVNPANASGNTYEYKTSQTVALPALGADPGSSFAAWNGTDEITATTGNQIAIVEVDGDGIAVKGGVATVTSA